VAKKLDSELDAIYSAGAADLAAMAPPAPAPATERTPTAVAATQAAGGLPRTAGPTADDVVRKAKEMDVDPDFALALWSQESGRNSNTKDSPKGAVGGFQVMPDTYKGVMGSYAGQRDPWKNMEAGLKYIAYGQKALNTRDPELLAAGYHAGYDRDDLKAGKIPDTNDGLIATRDYAKSIAARLGLNDPAKVEAKLNRDEPGRYKAITPEEAARIEAQQAADAEEPGRYKVLTLEEAARLEQQAPAQAATDEPGTIGKGGAAGVMTGRDLPAPRNQSLAPVRPEFRAAVQRQYDAATPEQRANMVRDPGAVGQLAREMQGVQQDATRTPTADLLDTTAEGRARRLARAGANGQTAERFGRTGAERGTVPGTELGTMGQSDFDFQAQQAFNKGPLSHPAIRAAVKGYEGYKVGSLGLAQATAELLGANDAAETARRGIKSSQARTTAIGESPDALQRNFEGAVSSIAQQLPALLGGVATGGSAVPLAAMFTQTFGQEYGQTRAQGIDPGQAATRAAIFGAFEVLGEKFGLGNTMEALKMAARGAGTRDIATTLAKATLKEIPGEQLTTLGQFLTDKVPGVGTNLEAGLAQYLSQAGDTLAQTMMQGGLMMGGTTGVSAGVRHLQGGQTQATQELAAEQARENALAKAAAFGGRNPNAPATPPAPPSGPIGRAVQKGTAPAPTAEVEGEDGQTYGITVGPDGLDVAALSTGVDETQPVDSQGNLFAESGTEPAETPSSSGDVEATADAPTPTAPTTAKPKAPESNDARYQAAVDFVRQGGAISPNAIMQKLRVGYTAADRFVRRMADEGVIAADDLGNYALSNTPAGESAPAPVKAEQAPGEAAPMLTPAKPLAEMTEPELRERMQYIAQQKKLNGGSSKLFADERRKVEAEIERRKAAPAPVAVAAEEQEPPAERTASGAYVKQSDANDAVRAAARSTGQPHQAVEREEDGRAVFDVKPLEEGNGPVADGRADSGRADVAAAEPVPAPAPGPANQPGSAGAAAVREPGNAGRGEGAKAGGHPALSPDLAGAKPRYAHGNKQFTPTFDNDIDRAAFIASQTTPSKRDADYVKFVQDATGWTEDEVRAHGKKVRETIKGMAKDAEAGPLAVPAVHGTASAAADAEADAEVKAKKQPEPAANPHAGKWFGTKAKADDYIAKKKADGYEATQTGKVRWEITPKTESQAIKTPETAPVASETPRRAQPGDAGYTLLDARNDLIDLRTQVEAQGNVVDDRLLERVKRQEKLVKEMEAAEGDTPPETPDMQAAERTPRPSSYPTASAWWNALTPWARSAVQKAAGKRDNPLHTWSNMTDDMRGDLLRAGTELAAEGDTLPKNPDVKAAQADPVKDFARAMRDAGLEMNGTNPREWNADVGERGEIHAEMTKQRDGIIVYNVRRLLDGKDVPDTLATINLSEAVMRIRDMRTDGLADERAPAAEAKPATHEKATAPEHVVGVDDRELGQIVTEFNAAQASMVEADEKVTHVFDAPPKGDIVRLQDKARVYHKDHGWMTPAEAKKVIQGWKAHAAEQGDDPTMRSENSQRVVLSLFDLSGEWSKPWEEAGYQVYRFDIQDDPTVGDVNNFSTEFFSDWFGDFDGQDVYAILAACPCTDFASSGARHFAAKDADGRTVASVKLVHQTLAAIEYFKPPVWALENPVGRIEKLGGLPPWRLSFDPNHLGDPYTKKTLIWGRFNGDLPIAPVEPTEGSKMHKLYGGKSLKTKNARSETPEGFSYGFFMANNAIDHPVLAVSGKYDRLDRDLIQQALDAGVTPDQIDSAVEDFYYQDLDDAAANDAIRDLIPEGGPAGGKPEDATDDLPRDRNGHVEQQPKLTGEARWPDPIPMGKGQKATDLLAAQKQVVSYMNGDITRSQMLAALQDSPLLEGEIYSITQRLVDDAPSMGEVEAMLARREKGEPYPIANQSPDTTIEVQEGAENDGQATIDAADAGATRPGAEAVQPHEGSGDAERVPAQPAGGDAGGDSGRPAGRARGAGQRGKPRVRGESAGTDAESEQRGEDGRGSGDSAGAGDHRGAVSRVGNNHRIEPADLTRTGSWRDTAERNVEIVELVKRLMDEGRRPTPDEAKLLSRFTGWGASEIANGIFPDQYGRYKSAGWQALGERLKAALTDEEYAQAKRTTQYAHYTSAGVIGGIYDALGRMGFAGGKIAEPGMGIGLFNGLMPAAMAANSQYTGIEYDTITGNIAKLLYPESNIIVGDYSKTALPRDFFDAAIGNPPFSQTVISNDPEYKKQGFMLHDYFFAKTIDRVRPGGMLVFVTSKGTMDKGSDRARKYLADRANLVGAIRLPQTAFKDNAGTEVVTDVLFLQKKGPGVEDNGVAWRDVTPIDVNGTPVAINEYFVTHPEMVLGQHATTGSMYRANEYTVEPRAGQDMDAAFGDAVARLPEGIYQPGAQAPAASRAVALERDFNPLHKKEGGLYVSPDGTLMQVDSGTGVPLTTRRGADGKAITLKASDKAFLTSWVTLRDALKQAQLDQLTDGNWEASLAALAAAYDTFTKKHGNLLAYTAIERELPDGTTSISKRFKNDPLLRLDVEGALAYSLEHIKESGEIVKAPVLSQRVLEKRREPEIKTTQDALFVSLNNLGRLDLDEVAKLAGMTRAETIDALGTAIYQAPGRGWQTADEYLAGNVRRKLDEAQAAARTDRAYQRNVDALLAVQPKPLGPTEITVKLGQSWIPPKDVAQFATEVMGETVRVTYNPAVGAWSAEQVGNNQSEYNFNRMRAGDILEAVLNNKQIRITNTVKSAGKTETVVDAEATEKANDIARKMREAFSRWVWTDTTRADRLVNYYNEHFNNIAPRKFDGSHLTLPGVSLRFDLYAHQKRAIWRMVQEGDTYLAHAVGAGKTFTMIAAGMEERRLGLANKPMYVVPNHMLAQFAREFLELYPAANIMVADEQNFHTHNRRRFVAQAALNNPDAIVITHSAFGRIGMSDAYTANFIKAQIAEWTAALDTVDKSDRITRKQVERRIEALERRLESRQGASKDQVLTFEELGVDRLYVDEGHEFRKLDFATNQGNIKGIDPNGSQRAMDLFMKTQYLRSMKPGRALVMASGTPVTNTMGELYTVQRFFQPEQMAEDGLDTFDAWANQYGDVVAGFEQNAAGGYEVVSRFAKFQNVPELMRRVRSFMDILTNANLGELVQRPDVAGGGREVIVTPSPMGYKAYQASLEQRIKAIRDRKGPPKPGDDIILKVISDGRFSAIDMRFVDPTMPSDPNSKLNQAIDRVIAAYNEGKDFEYSTNGVVDPIKGSSVILFTDIGLGEQSAASRGFDMKAWIEKRLIDAGIPAGHIAFMRDNKQHAKKERLFADMRAGKKRILIGGKDMETGVNVQKRLSHLFHLDAPWFPSSVEQREGRIVRQGNQNRVVSVQALATKGSYDSTMWGMNGRKARFIEQAMNGDDSVRSLEDVSEASAFEMAAALASGDERYMRLAGLKADVDRLERLAQAHHSDQNSLRAKKNIAEASIRTATDSLKALDKAMKKAVPIKAGEFTAKLGKTTYDNRDDFSKAVFEQFAGLTGSETTGTETIGEIGGFPVQFHGTVLKGSGGYQAFIGVDLPVDVAPLIQFPLHPDLAVGGIATRAANQVNNLEQWRREAQRDITESERRIEQIDKRLGAPFPEQQEMLEKMAALQALEIELSTEKGADVSADAAAATVATETGAAPAGLVEEAPNAPRQSVVGPEPVNGTAAKLLRETLTGGEFGPLVQSMLDAGKLVIHETPASVPAQTSRGVQAVTLPDGTIHMVARNLDMKRAAPVLLHEMFHAGVRPLLGETQWKNLMVRLHALQRQAVQSTGRMRQFWDAAFARQRHADTVGANNAMHPEEFGAYAIEEYEQAPVAVKRWVDDALGAIKAWLLRVFGMQVGKVTPPQLRALALAALKRAGRDGGTPDDLDLSPAASQSVAAPTAPAAPPAAPTPAPVAAGLTPDAPTRFERLQEAVQDNMNRVKKVQARIQKQTGLGDLALADYYRAETNRPGRIAARLEDAQRQLTGPLMARLAKEGFTPAQLEELLHAQHAQERNERIAQINPDMQDGGSGMTTAEANKILAKVPLASPLREIAQQARDIAAATLDLKQAYGLIDQETHDTLTKAYKHYVPLKGDGEFGPKIKRAMGHDEREEHILENIARDYDQAVVVGEKNLARQSLLALVAQHPDPSLWSIGVPPKGRYVAGQVYNVVDPSRPKGDQTIGSFNARSQVDAFIEGAGPAGKSYIVLDSNGDRVQQFNKPLQDNEVMVYVKGQPVRMQFHDEALARQVRPLDTRQLHPILEFMRGMNRYLSKIYTGYNPSFILRNAARDALTGTINMTGNEGAAVAARAWTRYPAALKAMTQWAATGKAPAGKTGQYVQEYRNNGGKTGASWMSDLEQQGKTLTRMYEDAYGAGRLAAHGHGVKAAKVAGRKIVGGMAHGIEVINQGTENALRLALYITLRERGETPARAAQAAKRVTVDFDRKGTTTGALGAIYLFMNPAIQGTANAMQTLVKGKHKYQAMAALGMLAALGFYAAAAGMDDDRDRWLGAGWDQRTKNFRLHLGNHTLNIPLSQEFAPAYAFGVGMAEALRGESAMKSAVRMVSSFVDAYFPLNGFYNPDSNNHGLDAVLAATPTIIRPGAELAANRNVFGGQIVPENDRSKTQPDNAKMFRATKGTFFDALAQQIAAGGEKLGAGKFENDLTKVSPETLKYLWRTYSGGLGQFVTDSIGAGALAAGGSSMNSGDIPIAKDFWKPDDVKPIRGRYYDLANEARAAADEFRQARKAGDDEAAGKLLDRPGTAELVSLSRMFTQAGKAAAALRDEAADINADPALTTAQKRDQLSALERQEEALYRSAIEVFNESVKK
jgi:N12 class adenine-specific DNA methylase